MDIKETYIASFDIGFKNFAFYIEKVDLTSLENIQDVEKDKRFKEDGTPTDDMNLLLDKLYKTGTTILHVNTDISQGCNTKIKSVDNKILLNMNDLLDKYHEYWSKCSSIVIEQQMQFGRFKQNTKAVKIGHHCQSYFLCKYKDKHIIEFPSYYKTQILGCQKIKGKKYKNGNYSWKSISKPNRKKWAIVKATDILKLRNEENHILNIKNKSKKDDLADTLVQLQSYKYIHYIEKDNLY